jgi:hypothetical protein
MKLFGKPGEKAPLTAKVDVEHPKTGLPELDENPGLFKLILYAVNEACNEVVRTGEQWPFAAIETPSGRFIQGFRNARLELAYEEARRALLTAPSDAQLYALAWAAYLTHEGVRYETVMVEGGERGKARGVRIGQKYKQHLPEVRFQPIGDPAVLGSGDNLLTLASDSEAASRLRPVFMRITADIDHDQSAGKAQSYEFRRCQELVLAFGDLGLPFRKELQKKPDMVHVVMNRRAWATIFNPDAKEVVLGRDTLYPIRGAEPFPGFKEDGVVMIGYMPPPPTGNEPPAMGMFVLWAAMFKVTYKEQA